jgi:pimeloyl-ACP methyl ester carboxylesterase
MNLFTPLLRALAPLTDGFLRRLLLRLGVEEHQVALCGGFVNYYYRRPAPVATQSPRRRALSAARRLLLRQQIDRRPTPILLIHGLGDNALTWSFVLGLLAPGRAVYAIDLPGYGLSNLPPGQAYVSMDEMRVVLECFLHEVIGRPALVVGNSLGAWLAVKLALAQPRLVRELVLINAGGAVLEGRSSWEPFRDLVAVPDLKTTRRAIRQVLGFVPAVFLYIGQHSIQERFQRQVVRAFVEQADEADFLSGADLEALSVPTTLAWGLADNAPRCSTSREILAAIR